MRHGIDMQWRITLHYARDIVYHGCECMAGKSTLLLVIDWVDLVSLDEV